jgi:hypothetical protein
MIVVACAALVALAITAKAGATGANPIVWMSSDSGPLALGSKLDAASPTTTTSATLGAQDADNDGDSAEASANESAQDNDQSEQAQEQELSGVVASVDPASSAFTLTTTSGAITVRVNSATQYEDGLSGLASLRAGLSVTVKGAAQALGQTLADEVKGSPDSSAPDGADMSSSDSGN